MKGIIFFLVLTASLFSYSCKMDTEVARVDESYKFFNLEQVGWKSKSISHNFSNIGYTATLVPIQYYIIKNEGFNTPSKIDSIYKEHKQERVIEMEFRHGSKDDLLKGKYTHRDYENSVKYMAFQIENDFKVITALGDTISCAGVTFERNFKLAPFKRLLLHFGGIPEDDNIRLLYNDELFGNGLLEYRFNETPLKL